MLYTSFRKNSNILGIQSLKSSYQERFGYSRPNNASHFTINERSRQTTMSTSGESEEKPRRSSRWSRRGRQSEQSRKNEYIPPTLDGTPAPSDFVTSPPKQRGLTSGISTLFRRASSREPDTRDRSEGSSAVDSSAADSSGLNTSNNSSALSSTLSTLDSNVPGAAPATRNTSRIFCNEDSDDSYESRISGVSAGDDRSAASSQSKLNLKRLSRFRGFSTSIQSLFLDESLVCASMGCFGLLLSQRTEFLLDVRNRQRGLTRRSGNKSAHRHPSRLVAYALFAFLILMGFTFIVWGFGTNNAVQEVFEGDYDILEDDNQVYYQSNDDDGRYINDDAADDAAANDDGNQGDDGGNYQGDDGNYNQGDDGGNQGDDGGNQGDDANYQADDGNQNDDANANYADDAANNGDDYYNDDDGGRRELRVHRITGICKIREYKEHLWDPAIELVKREWYRDDRRVLSSSSASERDVGSTTRLVLALMFLLILGIVGRRRRMRTRYAIVRARAQEDNLYYAAGIAAKVESTEDNYEGACSHTLLGCYPVDASDDPDVQNDEGEEEGAEGDDESGKSKKKRKHQDCVSRSFECFTDAFCGVVCKCWFQFFSICALAQEAREIRLLVPPKYQRVDYVTHQPFSEYQTSVNDLRRGWMGKTRKKSGVMPHIQALSRLSRYILIGFSSTVAAVLLTLLFNPRASFSLADAIVTMATFLQSFLVLYVVHWIFHKSDLSLDAVIKLFAAGFLIGVPSSLFFEGILVNLILGLTYSLYNVYAWIFGEAFEAWVARHYRFMWILSELLDAYVAAAITEELCKYYTFRAVEHPDLMFLTGLHREVDFEKSFEGGVANYAFGSHQISELNRNESFGSIHSHRSSQSTVSKTQAWIDKTRTEEEFYEDEHDVRTYRQKAAAVTTGMISVAVGLACAENFMYVFILGGADNSGGDGSHGGSVLEEWVVLFFRSIFPVHALAAAMQSINMVRKFVEGTADANQHRIGVGRIILPAVLLHGSFDAILYGINVYVESSWDAYLVANNGNVEDGATPYNPVVVNLVAWVSIIFIMLIAILWFYRENRAQRTRLDLMEEKVKAGEPPVYSIGTSEVELV